MQLFEVDGDFNQANYLFTSTSDVGFFFVMKLYKCLFFYYTCQIENTNRGTFRKYVSW